MVAVVAGEAMDGEQKDPEGRQREHDEGGEDDDGDVAGEYKQVDGVLVSITRAPPPKDYDEADDEVDDPEDMARHDPANDDVRQVCVCVRVCVAVLIVVGTRLIRRTRTSRGRNRLKRACPSSGTTSSRTWRC